MQKAIQRIQKGFREHLGYTLLYAFLIYMIIAVALWLPHTYQILTLVRWTAKWSFKVSC